MHSLRLLGFSKVELSNCAEAVKHKIYSNTTYYCQRHVSHTTSGHTPSNSFTNADDNKIYRPLHGLKVLDLTRVLAGPYCTMIMGDLGADVIKVEKPGGGDDTRAWGPPWVDAESPTKTSAYFVSINRNKRSIAVDMKYPEGSKIVQDLACKCDILVENYIPGKLAKMGLGYEELNQKAPHLIYTSITGFGQTGPYSNRGGYDNIAAAIGGLMHITGPQDGAPCRVGVAMTDLSTGLYALGATLAAVLQRQQTGRGQHIDCNLLSTQVATLTHIASNYLNCGLEAKRWGSGHSSIVPYQSFKTKDGYLMIGAGNEKLFQELCRKIDLHFLLEDDRFSSNERRVENRDALIAILSERFATKTDSEWCDILSGSFVPYGPVNSLEKVFSDPQVHHNKMVQEINHPKFGNLKVPAPAVSYSAGDLALRHHPPGLGEHTDSVLEEILGYKTNKIEDLRQRKIIQG